MKKVFVYIFLFLVLSSFLVSINLVASQQTNFDVLIKEVKANLKELKAFSDDPVGMELRTNIASILLGLLLWMILYSVFKSMNLFEQSPLWSGLISLIVALLAFLYLPSELIDPLSTQYAALGATILTVIPFIIAIYFTVWVTPSLTMARAIWFVFFVYYAYIWGTSFVNPEINTGTETFAYLVAFLASIVLFIFMGPVREMVWKEHIKGLEERGKFGIKRAGVGKRILESAAKELAK